MKNVIMFRSKSTGRLVCVSAPRQPIELSLLAALGIGAGLHVAQNAATKVLMNTKKGNGILASVFQSGQRHARKGTQLHPGIRRASDMILGPEYSHMYEKGLAAGKMSKATLGKIKDGVKRAAQHATSPVERMAVNVTTGRQNKFVSRMLDKLPSKSIRDTSKGWAGGAIAGAAAAAVEPVLPAINGVRTYLANSKIGDGAVKGAFNAGKSGKPMHPLMRAISDYAASPALGAASDFGGSARRIAYDSFNKLNGSSHPAAKAAAKRLMPHLP